MEVPLNILQIESYIDVILDDDMNKLGLPSKGLLYTMGDDIDDAINKNLAEIYDPTYYYTLHNYGLWGCSIPKFKIEYLKMVHLYILDKDENPKFLQDVSYMIDLTEQKYPADFPPIESD